MWRMVIPAALVLVITAPLARGEILSTAEYAALIHQMDELEKDYLVCDCAVPSPDCAQPCNAEPGPGWLCGTHVAEMDRRLREALIRGDRPDVIEDLIQQHPAPFSRSVLLKNWEPPPIR